MRLKAGDGTAYAHLVSHLSTRLRAVALRILRDEDAAGDAVQDAFVQAFRAMRHFDGEARLSTWLHRIVVNTCLMRLRRARRRPEGALEWTIVRGTGDRVHRELVAAGEPVDEHLERRQLLDLLRQELSALPAPHRQVLVLRDIEERSTREAAAVLGVSDNALKLRLVRARRALARTLRQRLASVPATRRPRRRVA